MLSEEMISRLVLEIKRFLLADAIAFKSRVRRTADAENC